MISCNKAAAAAADIAAAAAFRLLCGNAIAFRLLDVAMLVQICLHVSEMGSQQRAPADLQTVPCARRQISAAAAAAAATTPGCCGLLLHIHLCVAAWWHYCSALPCFLIVLLHVAYVAAAVAFYCFCFVTCRAPLQSAAATVLLHTACWSCVLLPYGTACCRQM